MTHCIELARRGAGEVSPNPMVGCVVVKDGRIIGEGYHAKYGEAHAEVNAIRSATESVQGAELYVNLEPCSFFGKTPPCVDLLIEKQIGKVYVSMLDPNPLVNGKGIQKLRAAGIEVEVGIEELQARRLNEIFTKFITKRRPFVALKIGQSLDGRIALSNGKSRYITSKDSLKKVHELRVRYDSVLVGANTVRTDNPQLTVRFVRGRSPTKIVLDGNLSVPIESKIFAGGRTIIFHRAPVVSNSTATLAKIKALRKRGIELMSMPGGRSGSLNLDKVLKAVAALDIASVLVEGGAKIFSQFIESGFADKLHLFIAPKILGSGLSFSEGIELKNLSEAFVLKDCIISDIGEDKYIEGYF